MSLKLFFHICNAQVDIVHHYTITQCNVDKKKTLNINKLVLLVIFVL